MRFQSNRVTREDYLEIVPFKSEVGFVVMHTRDGKPYEGIQTSLDRQRVAELVAKLQAWLSETE